MCKSYEHSSDKQFDCLTITDDAKVVFFASKNIADRENSNFKMALPLSLALRYFS